MKRRNFIKNISKLSSTPLLLNGIGVSPFITPVMLSMLNNCEGIEDRSVVVLFLKGGNDGLNTFIPVDQYSTYFNHRPDIAIPDSGAKAYLNLDTTLDIADQVGIHPVMTSFKEMYDAGKARIIQAVGYPSMDGSHFKSSDNWNSGNDGENEGSSAYCGGWIGRFFQHAYPGLHETPTPDFQDPLGIQFGDAKPSIAFHDCYNTYQAVNLHGQNPAAIAGLLNGLGTAQLDAVPQTDHGREIAYIMSIENSTNHYGTQITNVFNAGNNSSTVYPDTTLASSFSRVARLLAGGIRTKFFQLHQGGFDTHINQVLASDSTLGDHATLLENVFGSIKAFHEDLNNLGLGHKVVTVVFSEFSRRIIQNGAKGTDHGNVGPMLLFGDAINPGISGTNFDLTAVDVAGFMAETEQQYDYRSVFKSVLQDWMGAGDNILHPAFFEPYPILPSLFKTDQIVDPNCYISPTSLSVELKHFTVSLNSENQVLLTWATQRVLNIDYFEIIRKEDKQAEQIIAKVAVKPNSSSTQHYQTIDETPLSGLSYYRLQSVNLNGEKSQSEWQTITIKNSNFKQVKIYPNPAIYDFNLVLNAKEAKGATMKIFNANGQSVYTQSIHIKSGFNKFNVAVADFKSGAYLLRLFSDNREVRALKLMVVE